MGDVIDMKKRLEAIKERVTMYQQPPGVYVFWAETRAISNDTIEMVISRDGTPKIVHLRAQQIEPYDAGFIWNGVERTIEEMIDYVLDHPETNSDG